MIYDSHCHKCGPCPMYRIVDRVAISFVPAIFVPIFFSSSLLDTVPGTCGCREQAFAKSTTTSMIIMVLETQGDDDGRG